jgi:hypothetical protein
LRARNAQKPRRVGEAFGVVLLAKTCFRAKNALSMQ